jgi:hypothetical protein
MAVSKTLLSPRPFSATGRQKAARAYPEPMETEEWEKFADGRAAIAHRGSRDVVILIWVMRNPGDAEVSDEPSSPARPKE